MTTLTYTTTLIPTSCWCGIAVAIPQELMNQARDNGHAVYCPIGHTFVFADTFKKKLEEEKQRLEAERRRHRATRDLLEHEERSHSATRGHLTRQKKRASAGVGPCCNRTFQQLARHMQSKHPEFVAEQRAA